MVSRIHLHHGVWLSTGGAGQGEGNSYVGGGIYPFMATGEEKTITTFPHGYGYPVAASDKWILNYMIHNLTSKPDQGLHQLRDRFRPRDSTRPRRGSRRCTRSGWTSRITTSTPSSTSRRAAARMGSSRSRTWPRTRTATGRRSRSTSSRSIIPGTLIGTAGHLHPGGLYDTLDLIRQGAHAEQWRDSRQRAELGPVVPLLRALLR